MGRNDRGREQPRQTVSFPKKVHRSSFSFRHIAAKLYTYKHHYLFSANDGRKTRSVVRQEQARRAP